MHLPGSHMDRKQRRAVWIGLSLAIIMNTLSQISWKAATMMSPAGGETLQVLLTTFRQPLFHIAVGLFIVQFFNWMWVLSNADLSYAQPITAMNYVLVTLAAWHWFGEEISQRRLIAIGLILLGVFFISRRHHDTGGRRRRHLQSLRAAAESV